MNNTGRAKYRVGNMGGRKGFRLISSRSIKKKTVGKHKTNACVVSDLSERKQSVESIQQQHDSWRQVGCSGCIFLSIPSTIKILLDSPMSAGKPICRNACITETHFQLQSEWLHSERSGPSSLEVINAVSALLKDTCPLCYTHMPGSNRSLALLRCTVG